jgi:hypothetical protein
MNTTTHPTTQTWADRASRVRSRVDFGLRACWCGQELDGRQTRFCPRCGTACRPRTPVVLSLPAI